jgi:hypothetical protein
MALSILDGNQTAVTLATTVLNGFHYPNHIIASGAVTANVFGQDVNGNIASFEIGVNGGDNAANAIPIGFNGGTLGNFSIVGSNNPLPISGTVTIGSIPNGALTTRFGSIAAANTAFATTAVTNTSRKYLMIQNIASTVITAGIGFTPTTTQGIQLVAGATITYDGNYIPTGAVRILSSVTSSNFTVLEA